MANRVREKSKVYPGPYVQTANLPGGIEGTRTVYYQTTHDIVPKQRDKITGRFPATPFYTRKIWYSWSPTNFRRSPKSSQLTNLWLDGSFSVGTKPLAPAAGRYKSDTEYFTMLLERTNPYRPEVSIPVFTMDLVELATLFRLNLKKSLRGLGSNYLNISFGWLPFLKDLKTFVKITEAIERRMREFDSLVRIGGLKRTIKLDSFQAQSYEPNALLMSSPFTVYGPKHLEARYRISGGVRWTPMIGTPTGMFPSSEPLERFNAAVKAVLDLDWREIHPDTIWELIPFSWLIDYFVNIDSVLRASRGRLLVYPRDIWISETIDYKTYVVGRTTSAAGVTLGDTTLRGKIINRKTQRDGWMFGPMPSFSFLNKSQAEIIAALIASRSKW